MHHHSVRSTDLIHDRQHIIVGIAIVNHDRLVDLLSNSDVLLERMVLSRSTRLVGAEVVQTCFANGTYSLMHRQLGDLC